MRKMLCLSFVLLLLSCLWGCQLHDNDLLEPVEFYYTRAAYVYGSGDGVITPEQRDAANHRDDLSYLLTLYLQGPLDSELQSPFPADCILVNAEWKESDLHITLGQSFSGMKEMEQTIAGACLAKTFLPLTGAEAIHITSYHSEGKTIHISFTADNLLLEDNIASVLATEPEQSQ